MAAVIRVGARSGWSPIVVASLSVAVLTGCAERADPAWVVGSEDGCVTTFEPERDYFPAKADIRHARHFDVEYRGHYKVLRARMPTTNWGPAVSDVVVLNLCGTPAPALVGELEGAPVVEIPVERYTSTSLAGVLRVRLLGLEDRIAAIPPNPFDSALAARLDSGAAFPIGTHGTPNYEELLVEDVQAYVRFVFDPAQTEENERARALGIGAIPLLSWAEPTYLGQVEWIKHHAVLFDAEARAEEYFRTVEERYQELARIVEGREPVTALWATPVSSGRWWVEVGNWQEEVLEAAGGRSVFQAEPGESAITLASERLIEAGGEIAVWITGEPDASVLTEAIPVDEIAAWSGNRTWHVHRRTDPSRGAYDWNETPLVRPDLVLEDLIAILHPDLLPDHEPRFFARVGGADLP